MRHSKTSRFTRYFVGTGVAILVVFGLTSIKGTPANNPVVKDNVATITASAPTADELLRLTNDERIKAGVEPLLLDPLLNKSAQLKAEDMVNNGYFDHVDANGKHGYELITEVGKQCQRRSENIWEKGDQFTASMAVAAWKNSELHYKAMVSPEYESTGFGIAGDKIVQHFCDEN